VREVKDVPTFRVEKPVESGVVDSPEHWATLHEAMRQVIEAGTAGRARVPGVTVGGKTGTAQNPHGDDHALFVCVAPLDTPRIAIAVVAENSGHGGSVAAPIAGSILRRVLLGDSLATRPRPVAAPLPSESAGD
jgi:penicillin-binding protein 2